MLLPLFQERFNGSGVPGSDCRCGPERAPYRSLNDGSWGSEFSLDEHNRGAGPLFPSLALARPGWGAAVMMSARPVPMLNMLVFRFIFMIKDSLFLWCLVSP